MGKEKRKDGQAAQNTENFECKYQVILGKLKQMPRENQKLGEDSVRWRWFRQQPDYEIMAMDLFGCISPSARQRLDKLKNGGESVPPKTENVEENSVGMEEKHKKRNNAYKENAWPERNPNIDLGIADFKTKKYDADHVIFMEALRECVNNYSGISKEGKEYTFTQSVINRYKQLAGIAASERYIQKEGITVQTKAANMPVLLELVKNTERVIAARGNEFDSALEESLNTGKGKHKYTKEVIRDARFLTENLNIVSIDSIRGDEDGVSMEELISGGGDPAERFDEGDDRMDALGCLGKQWDTVVAATYKTDRNLLKAFLSRDVLVELKLRRLSPDELSQLKRDKSADYIKELEPLCRKWCPTRNDCQLSQSYGCYIRWGRLDRTEPPGDWEVYQILNRDGEILYVNILNNDYVQYAYELLPEGMYDLYANSLKNFGRGENSFEFTDTVMATALGLRKDTVSRGRKKYEGEVRAFIREQFLK
ncbi:MAG: hypothetical protein LUE87_04530 [Lachnospiraceae bacterium]|nr:hypothetical protein [Lachnospiraceae bacterium]